MESSAVVSDDLGPLVAALRGDGYRVIGPVVRDTAIVLDEIADATDLPWGYGVELGPGGYRVTARPEQAAFLHAAGPQSWKNYLHPARTRLWSGPVDGSSAPVADEEDLPPFAFLGVRPCDLRAIAVQDRVLLRGSFPDTTYARRRRGAFIVAVECVEPGATCFCTSMGTGPAADTGYDLVLTELITHPGCGPGAPPTDTAGAAAATFVIRPGTDRGAELLATLNHPPAPPDLREAAVDTVSAAAGRMGRTMPAVDLHRLMAETLTAERWDDVAARCLTCGNCTMVCPTCFCTTTEDVTDVTGDHAERWRLWDSCFDVGFSYLHGGSVRASSHSRYRQWLTHKLGTWHDQFDSSGCVGCGRCIVWCPVGIDLTVEAAALAEERDTAAEQGASAASGNGDMW